MLERGEISFVFLWVLNPIVILFYQNCSYTPPSRAEVAPAAAVIQSAQTVRPTPSAPSNAGTERVPSSDIKNEEAN